MSTVLTLNLPLTLILLRQAHGRRDYASKMRAIEADVEHQCDRLSLGVLFQVVLCRVPHSSRADAHGDTGANELPRRACDTKPTGFADRFRMCSGLCLSSWAPDFSGYPPHRPHGPRAQPRRTGRGSGARLDSHGRHHSQPSTQVPAASLETVAWPVLANRPKGYWSATRDMASARTSIPSERVAVGSYLNDSAGGRDGLIDIGPNDEP